MNNNIYGKVCICTGGGGGIGRALCEQLAIAGARVVLVTDIDSEAASAVASSISAMATHPSFRSGFDRADVGKEEDIRRVIRAAFTEYGSVDAFFSNAGILMFGGVDPAEVSDEDWEKIWNVNVMSHVYAARHLFPLWKERRERGEGDGNGGIFVVTASAAGLLAQPGSLPYSVTKHAAVAVSDWLAIHEDGISFHCLCPQAVKTPMLESNTPKGARAEDIGIAAKDGAMDPKDVALETLRAIDEGRYLVLPHPTVHTYSVRRAKDCDRWIHGMRKIRMKHAHLMKDLKSVIQRSKL